MSAVEFSERYLVGPGARGRRLGRQSSVKSSYDPKLNHTLSRLSGHRVISVTDWFESSEVEPLEATRPHRRIASNGGSLEDLQRWIVRITTPASLVREGANRECSYYTTASALWRYERHFLFCHRSGSEEIQVCIESQKHYQSEIMTQSEVFTAVFFPPCSSCYEETRGPRSIDTLSGMIGHLLAVRFGVGLLLSPTIQVTHDAFSLFLKYRHSGHRNTFIKVEVALSWSRMRQEKKTRGECYYKLLALPACPVV